MPSLVLTILMLITLHATGCGESDLDSSDPCAGEARAFDESEIGDEGICLGDTVMLRLDPDGAGMRKSFDVEVPQAGRVRFCLDLGDTHPHRLELSDESGTVLSRIDRADGCDEVDLGAGHHVLRVVNGKPRDPDGLGYILFLRPTGSPDVAAGLVPARRVARGGASPSDAEGHEGPGYIQTSEDSVIGTSTLLGTFTVSSNCPNCDLRGVDFSGVFIGCFDKNTGNCSIDNPGNSFCEWVTTKGAYNYGSANNLSGARFGGANFLGSQFFCVNFVGAQFWDDSYGQARLGVGPSCCVQGFPPRPTIFESCLMSGTSFRNVDLTATQLSCGVPEPGDNESVYDPSILAGVDLRGANLTGVSFSSAQCSADIDPANPFRRLDLSDALLDANTKLQNADLSSADLSGWDWRATDWSTATFHYAVLAHGNMSGIDFTASKYAGKFFIADKNSDRFRQADFAGVDFTGAKLAALDLEGAHMPSANFTSANLHGVNLAGANFLRANFTLADLGAVTATEAAPAVFNGATMVKTYLQHASLPGSFFRGAQLTPANLAYANLSGAYFEIDPACLNAQNQCIASNPSCVCQAATLSQSFMLNTILAGAHMTDAVLDFVSWYNVDPAAPVATGADALLTGASFNLADLPGLDLTGAFLQGAIFANAQLIGADLTGAHLGPDGNTRTSLSVANLRGANLTNTDLSSANLQNAGVDAEPEDEVYIEVLKDPDHYQAAQVYQYFAVNRPPTKLGGDGAGTITTSATCPSGAPGPCGPITNPSWVALSGPQEPTDCMPSEYDSEGNVIAVTCSSSRHPVTPTPVAAN